MGCLLYFVDSLSDINLSVFSAKIDEHKKVQFVFGGIGLLSFIALRREDNAFSGN